jgi:iron complex transport system substrate-binding protein
MKKWLILILILIVWISAGFFLFGRDGNIVQAAQSPKAERIIITAPNLTEILFALGMGEKIVGVTTDSDWPPAVDDIKKIGSFWQLDIEAIIAAKPDIVITLGFEQQRNIAYRLQRIGYPCVTVNIETLDEYYNAVELIGSAINAQQKAQALINNTQQKINKMQAKLSDSQRPSVLWIMQREPLRVAGADTFINEIINIAGGKNAIGKTFAQYPPISSEEVMTARPDVIIEPSITGLSHEQQLEQAKNYWRRFSNIPAVSEDRIYVINADVVLRLGPRIYEGIELTAHCLHPEIFAD